ncbi:RagB/SusD family nutrient uptake outer membrane protein [Danxiaibacter flavus]|uniref:RagB/SusD family nutrient uptake outer membrane protein n=1 Tax=Danxiaibacter flavus TaxID=3049108 RepID=A0ABV3ZL76_9BACT|nr:RagB/SusD family nutrient uptake outer membrane protein [Chitinophagaceae bacterium DXS]
MKQRIITALLVLMAGTSCTKFLDKTPLDKLTPDQAFSTENNLQLYINSFYTQMLPDGPAIYKGDVMADITVPNTVPAYVAGRVTPIEATGWTWDNLRNVNYFLDHYDNPSISTKARNHYGGIAHFFRAYFYYNMVKQFGDVPWYSHALAVDDSALYKARDSRAVVMDSVLADLNFAVANIYDTKDNSATQVTKWVALAYKSRICLFEGTFRKYHPEAKLSSSADKFLQEAADAASQLMKSGQYKLQSSGATEKDYRSLFISENPVSAEVILAAVYNNSLKKWHDAAWWYNSATLGNRLGLSKSFVNTYLASDGTAFTNKSGYDTLQFQDEVKNRDKRLQQTIRMGDYKRTDGSPAPPDFTVTYSGYQIQKFSLDDKYFDTRTESYNSIPIIRYAEVLLNYAEAKAELGTFTADDWNNTAGALRTRAGVKNNGLPVDVDAYMKANFFSDISSPVIMEIRRERGVELACEGNRYDDLRRWKAGKLLERVYDGIYVPAKGQLLDLNGDGKYDVCFVDKVPADKVSGVVYFQLDNNTSKLSQGDKGNLIWLSNITKKYEDKKYLYPIPYNEIILNPNLVQNPGWE